MSQHAIWPTFGSCVVVFKIRTKGTNSLYLNIQTTCNYSTREPIPFWECLISRNFLGRVLFNNDVNNQPEACSWMLPANDFVWSSDQPNMWAASLPAVTPHLLQVPLVSGSRAQLCTKQALAGKTYFQTGVHLHMPVGQYLSTPSIPGNHDTVYFYQLGLLRLYIQVRPFGNCLSFWFISWVFSGFIHVVKMKGLPAFMAT